MLRGVRLISSVAAAWTTRLLIVRTALWIGIEGSQILFFGGILVGILVVLVPTSGLLLVGEMPSGKSIGGKKYNVLID